MLQAFRPNAAGVSIKQRQYSVVAPKVQNSTPFFVTFVCCY